MQVDNISSLLSNEVAPCWSCHPDRMIAGLRCPISSLVHKNLSFMAPLYFLLLGKDGKATKFDETGVPAYKRAFNWNTHIRFLQHKVNIHRTSEIWEFVYCSLITCKGWRERNCQHGPFFSHIWTNGYNSTRVTLGSSVMWYVEGFNLMPLATLISPNLKVYGSF